MASTKEIQAGTVFDFSPKDTVTLLVGPEQKEMLVHGTYLARDSEFFKAALKKEWIEGATRTIKLPEENPKVMADYVTYTYSGKPGTESDYLKDHGESSDYNRNFLLLAALYVCGERFINTSIQQAVVKDYFRLSNVLDKNGKRWFPGLGIVNDIYLGTPEDCPGRRLMVDLYAFEGGKTWIHGNIEAAFLTDLAKALCDKCQNLKDGKTRSWKSLKPEEYFLNAGGGKFPRRSFILMETRRY